MPVGVLPHGSVIQISNWRCPAEAEGANLVAGLAKADEGYAVECGVGTFLLEYAEGCLFGHAEGHLIFEHADGHLISPHVGLHPVLVVLRHN